jgi:hypothetical protein
MQIIMIVIVFCFLVKSSKKSIIMSKQWSIRIKRMVMKPPTKNEPNTQQGTLITFNKKLSPKKYESV